MRRTAAPYPHKWCMLLRFKSHITGVFKMIFCVVVSSATLFQVSGFLKKFKQKPKHMILLPIMGVRCANLAHNMLNLINSYRSQDGLRPLKSIQNLEGAAKDQVLYMCENSALTHENPGGDLQQRIRRNGFKGSSMGENIAKNHSDGYDEVGRMWIDSPNHKKNIMGDFTYSGIATCLDKNGYRYWVQVFGGDGQSGYETNPPGDHEDGPFPSSDETAPESLGDSYRNPMDGMGDLGYRDTARPNNGIERNSMSRFGNAPRLGRGLRKSQKQSIAPEARAPGLSYKTRDDSGGEICFNIDSCKSTQTVYPSANILDSTISRFTVTQVKTSYIPVSSVIYKTLTRTVSQETSASIQTSSSNDKPTATQTVFMIINTSVPASNTASSKSEIPSTTKPAQTSISTVIVTNSSAEPRIASKTVTVTEQPEVKQITVTVTSKAPLSTSIVSVEKTVTAAPSTSTSERTITVIGQSSQVPFTSQDPEAPTPNTVRLRVLHSIPDMDSENNSEYSPKKAYNRYGEPWTEPKMAIYGPIESFSPRRMGSQEHSSQRTEPSNRSSFKQENQNGVHGARPSKYLKSSGLGHYLGTYFISDPSMPRNSLQLSSENSSQDQGQYLSNPCGSQDNPCIRTVFMRG